MANNFPSSWNLLPLEDCMEEIIDYRGKTPRKSSFGIPLITAKIVKNGRILEPKEFIPFEDYDERMQRGIPMEGDVVVSTEAPLGEVGQLDNRKLSVGQRLITIRGKDGLLDNTYLKFLMMSEFVQNQLVARATGTTVIGIKQRELRKVTLVVPPLPEQHAIADVLGALDDKIESNRRMNTMLESLARAVFRWWYVVNPKPEWHKETFGEIIEFIKGKKPKESFEEELSGCLPLILIETFNTGKSSYAKPDKMVVSKSNNVLMVMDGASSGRIEIGHSGIVGSTIAMIISKQNSIGNYFLYYSLKEKETEARENLTGTSIPHMDKQWLFRQITCIPSIEAMREFEQFAGIIRLKIQVNLEESRTLASLRDALLPKLMRGEVRMKW
jgi:type I restriction enzyme S subunit